MYHVDHSMGFYVEPNMECQCKRCSEYKVVDEDSIPTLHPTTLELVEDYADRLMKIDPNNCQFFLID